MAVPFDLARASVRGARRPMKTNSPAALSFTSFGTGCFAAAAASAPNLALLLEGRCCTTPREIVISAGSTFQRAAAGAGGAPRGSRRGARLALLLVGVRHRGAAAGSLHRAHEQVVVAGRVRGRALGADLAPVGVELLGDQRRQPGEGALAHLEVL